MSTISAAAARLGTTLGWVVLVGCVSGSSAPADAGRLDEVTVEQVAVELHAMSRGLTGEHRDTFDAVLADHLAKDAYTCLPAARRVLAPPAPGAAAKRIRGRMPHYGVYFGPMRYRIRGAAGTPSARAAQEEGAPPTPSPATRHWLVELNIAIVAPPAPDEPMELPDCELRPELEGPVRCEGTPYPDAPGVEACPDVGHFEALATRGNLRALLRRWSTEVEQSYNRDAAYFRLPVRYDFEFFLADDTAGVRQPVDLRLPLRLSCARTPYFIALRTGWSVPVVAHEMAHFLGLLDEYETLSGIVSFYPKTPFEGAEQSRMGLSMKRDTRLLPLHHYLVLRRYHCSEPLDRTPYRNVFP